MIPFNKPYQTLREKDYLLRALENGKFSGDGLFTKACSDLLEKYTGSQKALLTHSCTAALEMAAILADIKPGDEVIMPSYTFVSTANAFVLRGGIPVFIDIRPDTLNMDETLIEAAITPKTKAIVPVHYAGVGCEMETIMEIARKHNLLVIEDAAQGVGAFYKGKPLGSIGHLGCFSFHETKNIHCGEGGALLINDNRFAERAEIIREKGTNRSRFIRGQVDKYTWVDMGSSYLPSELNAAFLLGQLEQISVITENRLKVWGRYNSDFETFEFQGKVRRPFIPGGCAHNAHMYYLIAQTFEVRNRIIDMLKERGVQSVFHYIPLHSSPAGVQFGKTSTAMKNTDELSNRLLRLPLWAGLELTQLEFVIRTVSDILKSL